MTGISANKVRRFSLSSVKTKTKVMSAALFPLVLIGGVGALTVFDLKLMEETSHKVDHTQHILDEVAHLTSAAFEMEAGLRGYLLAGQEQYLEPYEHGLAETFVAFEELYETVSDEPQMVERLTQAENTLRAWQTEVAEHAIQLRRYIGDSMTMNDMAAEVRKAKGTEFFDAFRTEIESFIEEEEVSLSNRRQAFMTLVKTGIASPEFMNSSLEAVERSHSIISDAKDLQTIAVDLQAGMRGFLLVGENTLLDSFNANAAEFDRLVAELEVKSVESMMQEIRAQKMAKIIADWREQAVEPLLQLRREIGDAKTMDDMADFLGSENFPKEEFPELVELFRRLTGPGEVKITKLIEDTPWCSATFKLIEKLTTKPKSIAIDVLLMAKFESGRMTEHYTGFDYFSLFSQLGQIPANSLEHCLLGGNLNWT